MVKYEIDQIYTTILRDKGKYVVVNGCAMVRFLRSEYEWHGYNDYMIRYITKRRLVPSWLLGAGVYVSPMFRYMISVWIKDVFRVLRWIWRV